MAALPASTQTSPTVTAIYAWWEGKFEAPRMYLGGSQIGRECEREQWFSFRWCATGKGFDGRMLRLFNRGHREEPVFIDELRGIGLKVHDIDPSTGKQFRFSAVGGHFSCGIDGVALGVLEAPKTWHLLEMKTSNAKAFTAMQKDGVLKAKPEHHAQMQVYMHTAQLTRALYLMVNKDNDEIYAERVRYDEDAAQRLITKAERIVYASEPLPRLSEDPAFWKCKFCSFANTCHGTALPKASCRTCLHATPEPDGDGRWSCAKWKSDIPHDAQAKGCPEHLFIPALLAKWGEVVDASETDGWVEYKAADGHVFRNGPWSVGSYTSRELAAITPAVLRDSEFMAIREQTAARFVARESFGDEP